MITCTFENGNKAHLRHVVVHGIVEKDGKLLLCKRTGDLLESGKWSLPSGFLDRDETAEEGALRELREETGWEGKIISLFRIITRPDRPHEDRQNIAFIYLVKALQESGERDKESSLVDWVPINKLPPLPEFAFDHGESIRLYLEYRKSPFPLPLLV